MLIASYLLLLVVLFTHCGRDIRYAVITPFGRDICLRRYLLPAVALFASLLLLPSVVLFASRYLLPMVALLFVYGEANNARSANISEAKYRAKPK